MLINTKTSPDSTSNAAIAETWNFFDKVYCISIDERDDRRAQARRQFAATGLLERVEFVIVPRHPANRVKGIFESHMLCLKKGLEAGARHIMVFEDDVFFRNVNSRALRASCAHLAKMDNWNAFFLGCLTEKSRKTPTRSLVAITYRCLAHAYALHASFAERIIREEWNGVPFDELLRRNNADFFALYPMIAFQGLAGSDNQTVMLERLRNFFGGLPFIQRVNEWHQNQKGLFIAVHLAVLLLLGALTYSFW
jgi:GR25 family glycosyltransferase involved in LPS biosynthesis